MRMMLSVTFPTARFNELWRKGEVGPKIQQILEDTKPEAVYFTEQNGTRGAVLIIDVAQPSQIPAFAEPWFLNFNADCEFRIAMTPEDLQNAGLDELGEQWT